jgi:hypothetical protein
VAEEFIIDQRTDAAVAPVAEEPRVSPEPIQRRAG